MKYIFSMLAFVCLFSSCTETQTPSVSNPVSETTQNSVLTPEETQALLEEKEVMLQNEEVMEKDSLEKNDSSEVMKEPEVMKPKDAMIQEEKVMEPETAKTETMEKKWSYTAYSPGLVWATTNTVLFFHAAWCPSCRAADSGISSGTIPDDLTILKADYDTESELKKKYEVVSQHTFVLVDSSGEMIRKWTWGTTIDSIIEKLN
jgi:thiol-disulfide isomerase/thioredoxin